MNRINNDALDANNNSDDRNGRPITVIWSDRLTKTYGRKIDDNTVKLSSCLISDIKTANRVAKLLMINQHHDGYTIRWSQRYKTKGCCVHSNGTSSTNSTRSSTHSSTSSMANQTIFFNPTIIKSVEDAKRELEQINLISVARRLLTSCVDISSLYTSIYVRDSDDNVWAVHKPLANGGFGSIRKCARNETVRVLKLENIESKHLVNELEFYKRATDTSSSSRFPRYYGTGTCRVENNVEKRYISLEYFRYDLSKALHNRALSLNELKLVCYRVIEALQACHDLGFSHGDIKAGNVLINRVFATSSFAKAPSSGKSYLPASASLQIVLADFGLSRRYTLIDGAKHDDANHMPYEEHPGKRYGTQTYMSVDAHLGVTSSRRSDMESLGWCLVEWFGGKLTWLDVKKNVKVLECKRRALSDIGVFMSECFAADVPRCVNEYLSSVAPVSLNEYSSTYDRKPNYDALERLFATETR